MCDVITLLNGLLASCNIQKLVFAISHAQPAGIQHHNDLQYTGNAVKDRWKWCKCSAVHWSEVPATNVDTPMELFINVDREGNLCIPILLLALEYGK